MNLYLSGISAILILISCVIRMHTKAWLRQRGLALGERLIDVPAYLFGLMLFCFTVLCVFSAAFPKAIDLPAFIAFLVLEAFVFWFCTYSSRWFVIYDNEGFWYQTAFRKCKRFEYSEITSFKRILKDAKVQISKRRVFFDYRQDWCDFEESYRMWQKRNNIAPPAKKQYRTAIGNNLNRIEGRVGAFIAVVVSFSVGAVFAFIIAVLAILAKEVGVAIGFGLTGTLMILLIVLMAVAMSNPEKHERLFRVFWKDSLHDND